MIWGDFFRAEEGKILWQEYLQPVPVHWQSSRFPGSHGCRSSKSGPSGINTHMFKSSAVHGDPLMNLMIGNDAAAQISVQQDDNSTVKLRMIP